MKSAIGSPFGVGSDVVGTIVVGGEDFSYQPLSWFRLHTERLRTQLNLPKVIERDLDRETYSGQPTSSDKLLYLGYYRKFELYEIGGQEVAFHLDERMMVPKSELTKFSDSCEFRWRSYRGSRYRGRDGSRIRFHFNAYDK